MRPPFLNSKLLSQFWQHERGIDNTTKAKNRPSLKILLLLKFLQHNLEILQKHSQLNYKGPLEAGFLNSPSKIFLEGPKVKILSNNRPLKILNFLKGDRGLKFKIQVLEALRNLVGSVCINFKEWSA